MSRYFDVGIINERERERGRGREQEDMVRDRRNRWEGGGREEDQDGFIFKIYVLAILGAGGAPSC